MSKQPTIEQIREFWEWCGFKFEQEIVHDKQIGKEFEGFDWTKDVCIYPNGRKERIEPPIDLHSLFKYAEKLLVDHFIEITSTEKEYRQAYYDFLCKWLKDYIWNEPHDPALALFWALDKVREEENNVFC